MQGPSCSAYGLDISATSSYSSRDEHLTHVGTNVPNKVLNPAQAITNRPTISTNGASGAELGQGEIEALEHVTKTKCWKETTV